MTMSMTEPYEFCLQTTVQCKFLWQTKVGQWLWLWVWVANLTHVTRLDTLPLVRLAYSHSLSVSENGSLIRLRVTLTVRATLTVTLSKSVTESQTQSQSASHCHTDAHSHSQSHSQSQSQPQSVKSAKWMGCWCKESSVFKQSAVKRPIHTNYIDGCTCC